MIYMKIIENHVRAFFKVIIFSICSVSFWKSENVLLTETGYCSQLYGIQIFCSGSRFGTFFFDNWTKVELPSDIKPPLAKLCWRFTYLNLEWRYGAKSTFKNLNLVSLKYLENQYILNTLSLISSIDHDHDFLIQTTFSRNVQL